MYYCLNPLKRVVFIAAPQPVTVCLAGDPARAKRLWGGVSIPSNGSCAFLLRILKIILTFFFGWSQSPQTGRVHFYRISLIKTYTMKFQVSIPSNGSCAFLFNIGTVRRKCSRVSIPSNGSCAFLCQFIFLDYISCALASQSPQTGRVHFYLAGVF